jgi:hypothetical protein
MYGKDLDISSALGWEEGLPRPQWHLIESWIEAQCSADSHAAWTRIARQWMVELGAAMDDEYEIVESDHFMVLAAKNKGVGTSLVQFAEQCRRVLLSALSGIFNFEGRGKQVLLAIQNRDLYYRYISLYYPEGAHGASGGIHIREDFPHVVLEAEESVAISNTLAHELTHVALLHLSMPQWLEEGLAQMFEHNMTGRGFLLVDAKMAKRHMRYWGMNGLDEFWHGHGFSAAGAVQGLCYQLAEILTRLIFEEGRPRWFGLVRRPRERFFGFLKEASQSDCAAAACQKHLRCDLNDLAAKFLGPGAWSPNL